MNPTSHRQPPPSRLRDLYDLLTGDEDARVCKDIPESACHDLPENFFISLASLIATKTGDQLASAKLILAWLLTSLSAPAFMIALLVPIRDSLALVPQLVVAGFIRRAPKRKGFWVAGSLIQGLCVLGMAATAMSLDGSEAGWAILALLVAFSLARGVCSVSIKDVLGKTVSKRRRGTVSGYAAAIAGLVAVLVGVYGKLGADQDVGLAFLLALLTGAGMLWLFAALAYAFVKEAPGAVEGGGNAIVEGLHSLTLLKSDIALRRFVITRGLFLSTALAAPFYVVLARQETGGGAADLALLIIATGLASSLSAPLWGRLADISSRRVLIAAGLIAGLLGMALFATSRLSLPSAYGPTVYAAFFFILGVAHSGVRLGRKTYLVDLANIDNRAAYVAVSNTIIGILLLAGSLLGIVAEWWGTAWGILLLAALAIVAAASAWRLQEIE